VGIYPVFVALLAIPLLGEQLSNWQWFAVAVVVSGAVLISIRRDGRHHGPFITRAFWKLVAAALIFAFSDVGNKYALESLPTWNVYTINIFFMALVFVMVTLRPSALRSLLNMPRRGFNLFLVLLNVAIGMLGTWLIFTAMDAGPVSLVATIAGSRHAFVIFYGLLLHGVVANFIEWDSGLVPFLVRLVAILMITGGIAVIYLT
jgi:drug/metabolite transporter (DMT)-like permease